jgi:serine hydrolase
MFLQRNTMTPILVVPGLGGSPEHHWQTHLERSFRATRVEQVNWDRPDLAAWTERLVAAVEANPGAILVVHSLGCVLVAHLASTHPNLPIEGALMVAPADVDSARHTPQRIRSFAPIPLDRLPYRSVVVASRNDPFVTIERARTFAEAWGADFIDLGACGHINVASGFGRWHVGERILERLISRASAHRRFAAPRLGTLALLAAGR